MKVSEEDLGLLYPGRSRADFAAQALGSGVQLFVITRGGSGSEAFTAAHHAAAAPVPLVVIDTVGAGDTFQAELLCALSETGRLSIDGVATLDTDALSSLLNFATRAAAITCARRGADLPRRAEL